MEIGNYLNRENKIKAWPSKRRAKLAVLRHLANRFDTGRFYTEKEVNRVIDDNHAFGDYFLLRRELIECGYLERTMNGARYWRGGLWPKDECAQTERLLVRTNTEGDAEEIADVYRACGYIEEWTGMPHTEEGLQALLGGGDVPPGGSPAFGHIAVARQLSGGRLLGFTQYYTAWPCANELWVGLFLVHPACQRGGLGGEFVAAIVEACRKQNYAGVGLGVALRNQPALQFWVKTGFNRITKVVPDGAHGEGSLGLLGLRMEL